jgi:hypothetical protein
MALQLQQVEKTDVLSTAILILYNGNAGELAMHVCDYSYAFTTRMLRVLAEVTNVRLDKNIDKDQMCFILKEALSAPGMPSRVKRYLFNTVSWFQSAISASGVLKTSITKLRKLMKSWFLFQACVLMDTVPMNVLEQIAIDQQYGLGDVFLQMSELLNSLDSISKNLKSLIGNRRPWTFSKTGTGLNPSVIINNLLPGDLGTAQRLVAFLEIVMARLRLILMVLGKDKRTNAQIGTSRIEMITQRENIKAKSAAALVAVSVASGQLMVDNQAKRAENARQRM